MNILLPLSAASSDLDSNIRGLCFYENVGVIAISGLRCKHSVYVVSIVFTS